LHDEVVLGDDRLGLEGDDLLAQVDERLDAVDEWHDDRQTGLERAAVAAKPLDDPGARLRDDADGADRDQQHEHRYRDQHDETGGQFDASLVPAYSLTSAVAPRISTICTGVPASMTLSSS